MIFARWFLVLQNRWASLIQILFVKVACLILAVLHGHHAWVLWPPRDQLHTGTVMGVAHIASQCGLILIGHSLS